MEKWDEEHEWKIWFRRRTECWLNYVIEINDLRTNGWVNVGAYAVAAVVPAIVCKVIKFTYVYCIQQKSICEPILFVMLGLADIVRLHRDTLVIFG